MILEKAKCFLYIVFCKRRKLFSSQYYQLYRESVFVQSLMTSHFPSIFRRNSSSLGIKESFIVLFCFAMFSLISVLVKYLKLNGCSASGTWLRLPSEKNLFLLLHEQCSPSCSVRRQSHKLGTAQVGHIGGSLL